MFVVVSIVVVVGLLEMPPPTRVALSLATATCGGPPNDEIKHNNQPKYSIGDGGRLCDEI